MYSLFALIVVTRSSLAWTTAPSMPHGHGCRQSFLTASQTRIHCSSRITPQLTAVGKGPSMYLDSVTDNKPSTLRFPLSVPSFLATQRHPLQKSCNVPNANVSPPAETTLPTTHGMPWKESLCADYTAKNDHLTYMPFWEWQMQYMKQHLTNLREIHVVSRTGRDMSYVCNADKTMRMHTVCFASDEYQRIRLTTLDGGWRSQVFTSLWYPSSTTDPVLGIDLLQFNHAKKHLCIVDFQPISGRRRSSQTAGVAAAAAASTDSFESLLQPIRDLYPSLQGEMTDRFYHSNDAYFSNQMLLGRHSSLSSDDVYPYTAQSMVYNDLFPAFTQYVATHVDMVQRHLKQGRVDAAETIASCHEAYDTYSAARDPAHGLLAKCFGQTWADEYVNDVLFPSAQRPQQAGQLHP
jgi:15,16-dihydrobiliverdin:ferredoxin oxidoreductase